LPQKRETVVAKERDTVFIDLRGFDKNKKQEKENMETVQRILQITQSVAV
jgi:hypothetical protein